MMLDHRLAHTEVLTRCELGEVDARRGKACIVKRITV